MASLYPEQPSSNPPEENMSPLFPSTPSALTAEKYLAEGKDLFNAYMSKRRKKDLGGAVEAFQKALEYDTQNPALYLYLAKSMWEQGSISLELAKFYCQTAIQLSPNNWEAYFTLGTFLYQDGLTVDAARALKESIRRNVWKSARASTYLGQVLFQMAHETPSPGLKALLWGRGCSEILWGALRLPLDTQTSASIARAIVLDIGIIGILSATHFTKFIGMRGLSRKLLRTGSKLAPDDPIFYQLLGDDALFDHREPEAALEYYQKSLSRDPENVGLLSRISKVQVDLNDKQSAKAALEKIVEQDENCLEAHFNLSQIYIEEGALMKALFHLKESEKRGPRDPYVHSNMAYVLFKLDDIDGALFKYKHALSLGENAEWMSTVSQTIAMIYQQVFHDVAQAGDYFTKSIEYYPHNLEAWASLAQLQFEAGKLEDALRSYRHLLDHLPDSSECYCNIGYILWQLDKNEQAIEAYEISLRLEPSNVVARNNLGVIYLDDHEDAEVALALFEQALHDKPDYTMACFNRARALEMLGRRQEAATTYSQAKTLNSMNPELNDDEIDRYLRRLFY